jgi:TRAP-type C4-dicarboxylate transport system permease small subunit
MLEDNTGRVKLEGNINHEHILTGVSVGVIGYLLPAGSFFVCIFYLKQTKKKNKSFTMPKREAEKQT